MQMPLKGVTPDQLKKANEQMALARAGIADKYPGYTHALYEASFVATTAIKTMAMTVKHVLLWNPLYVLSRTHNRHIQTAIRHEIRHSLLKHNQRIERVMKVNPRITQMCANANADREINDDEFAAGESFGSDMDATVCVPSQIGAKNGLTMEEYIIAEFEFRKQQEQQKKDDANDDSEQEDGEGEDEDTDGEEDRSNEFGTDDDPECPDSDMDGDDADGEGDAGSTGGDGDADDDGDEAEQGGGQGGAGADAGAEEDRCEGGFGHGSCGSAAGAPVEAEDLLDPDLGKSPEALDEMREKTARAIVEDAKAGMGKYGGDMLRWAQSLIQPPKVRWQKVLERAVRGTLSTKAGQGTRTYLQPSRRQGGLGYGTGRPVIAGSRVNIPEVQVWVDTSGSMGSSELGEIMPEVQGILRNIPGKVTVGACDAKVQAVKKVSSVNEVKALIKGGGGTDFRPLFAHAEASKPRPDIVIVLTDGLATIPQKAPSGMRVVWVMIGKYKAKTMPWGEVIDPAAK